MLQAAVEAAQAQKALVNNLAQLPTQPPSPHAAASQPDWSQLFTLIGQHVAEAQKTILEAQVKMRRDRPPDPADLHAQALVIGARPGATHRGQGVRQRGGAFEAE